MDLAAKFKTVSDNSQIAEITRPAEVEFNKPFPIMGAHFYLHLGKIPIVTLSLQMSDEAEELAHVHLRRAYARVVDDDDIAEVNANPGKYKLIYRKKDCGCVYCHVLVIEM
jgi:hypothetical protein